jgi:hypothetical protein
MHVNGEYIWELTTQPWLAMGQEYNEKVFSCLHILHILLHCVLVSASSYLFLGLFPMCFHHSSSLKGFLSGSQSVP